jgi:hypothetical protein
MKRLYGTLGVAALAATLACGTAQAKSSSSHSSASSSHSTHSSTRATTKSLPAGTHFVRKTCKTASCKAKHPSGSYELPIKPKKTG